MAYSPRGGVFQPHRLHRKLQNASAETTPSATPALVIYQSSNRRKRDPDPDKQPWNRQGHPASVAEGVRQTLAPERLNPVG